MFFFKNANLNKTTSYICWRAYTFFCKIEKSFQIIVDCLYPVIIIVIRFFLIQFVTCNRIIHVYEIIVLPKENMTISITFPRSSLRVWVQEQRVPVQVSGPQGVVAPGPGYVCKKGIKCPILYLEEILKCENFQWQNTFMFFFYKCWYGDY